MYGAVFHNGAAFGGYLRVRSVFDVEDLVKTSEIVTGRAGREFVIASADRIRYLVRVVPTGFDVARLTDGGRSIRREHVRKEAFLQHSLGVAASNGCLFTTVVPD
jgi:hypothetical protein